MGVRKFKLFLIKGRVMKTAFSLLFLFVGLSAFAGQVQIDPTYLNDGVYSDEVGDAAREGVYEGLIDDPALIQVASPGGMVGCSRYTPIGIPCYCTHGILRRDNPPGWTYVRSLTWIRPGWHVTNYKGEHGGGDVCYKDRQAPLEVGSQRAI